MPIRFGGPGVTNTLADLTSNQFALQAGGVWLPPANGYWASLGRYSQLQEYDPIMTIWKPISGVKQNVFFSADGVNQRIANTSGCAVGALLTAAGSGYTSAPTVTASAGNSVWLALVGGAVNTTVTVAYGGTNYTQPPNVFFSAPPAPGVPATGYATISGGLVTSVTITNQGAGYTFPPTVSFFNDPRDSTGANASAVATLTGAGTVTAVLCLNHGNPLTSVPTLTFTGGGGTSAAATAIMNFAITGYAVTTAGAGYTAAAGSVTVSATPVPTAGTAAYTNPGSQIELVAMRQAVISAPVSSAGAITATGEYVVDGGSYEAIPTAGSISIIGNGLITTAAVLTLTVGGIVDNENYIYPN
jgi:hypothetical protein